MEQKRAEALTLRAYSDAQREWKRLVKDPNNKLEFDTTLHYVNALVPKKGKVLDAGAGPGRYSIYFAKKGYRITLLDLAKLHVEFAKRRAKRERVTNRFDDFCVGSILDLSRFPSNSFDVVLCLGGPLSHISSERNRVRSLSELVRVAKKGSFVFVSVMGKWGTLATPYVFFEKEAERTSHMRELAVKGEDRMWHGKYYAHYFTLDDIYRSFSRVKNAKILKVVGLQGLSTTWADRYTRNFYKHKEAWKNWMMVHYLTCEIPAVADTSRHILIVARKTG